MNIAILPKRSKYTSKLPGSLMNTQFADWREARRFRALDLSKNDWQQTDIAEALGVSRSAVSTWLKKARQEGPEALRTSPRPGRPPELSREERAALPGLLEKGAEHFGFRGAVWTRARVGSVIEETFGVSHCDSHVGRILREIGWSLQKPASRASQRDEKAIQRWKDEDWPRIKKKFKQKTGR